MEPYGPFARQIVAHDTDHSPPPSEPAPATIQDVFDWLKGSSAHRDEMLSGLSKDVSELKSKDLAGISSMISHLSNQVLHVTQQISRDGERILSLEEVVASFATSLRHAAEIAHGDGEDVSALKVRLLVAADVLSHLAPRMPLRLPTKKRGKKTP